MYSGDWNTSTAQHLPNSFMIGFLLICWLSWRLQSTSVLISQVETQTPTFKSFYVEKKCYQLSLIDKQKSLVWLYAYDELLTDFLLPLYLPWHGCARRPPLAHLTLQVPRCTPHEHLHQCVRANRLILGGCTAQLLPAFNTSISSLPPPSPHTHPTTDLGCWRCKPLQIGPHAGVWW